MKSEEQAKADRTKRECPSVRNNKTESETQRLLDIVSSNEKEKTSFKMQLLIMMDCCCFMFTIDQGFF